ncbi:MAG TPA: serine/threonine-protein kinase [Urbifossiella sp.]|jgi:serine/threonine protein kinase|nr:serine/threonine-protein kinase [Urbifossiella sp.]
MPQLSDLARVLVGCRVFTWPRCEQAAREGGGDLARTLDTLAAAPPDWWDGTPPAPPGLTDYQRRVIELRYEDDELAVLARDLALNQFLLLDKLGEGGQGKVYRARQLNPPRFVAIKTLTQDTESRRRRFEQEARSMIRVRHPGVARFYLYERVRTAAGDPTDEYLIAMELVEGADLAWWLRRAGPVPWPFAARWAIDLLGGLDAIHQNGFVHRDVKPENVMVVGPAPGPGVAPGATAAKLLDFGAVKPAGGDGADEPVPGQVVFVGTREYAPPEQWAGRVVPASDLYALGATLFQALTDRPPYVVPGRQVAAMIKAHTREPIPHVREYNPEAPAALDRLIHRMLAKDSDDRGTAAELMDEFQRLLDRKTGANPPPPHAPPPRTRPKPVAPPAPAARPAAAVDPEPDNPVDRITGSVLGALERVFLPARLRPSTGQEPPTSERIAALLRHPRFLITLAVVVALLFLLVR